MIKFFQKPTSKWTLTAVVIFISLGLVGFTNSISNATPATETLAKFNSSAIAETPNAEIENNTFTHNSWKLEVTDVKFIVGGGSLTQKTAQVCTTIESIAGRDTAMLLEGSLIGIVGSSGKTYDIVVKDPANHIDRSLDVTRQESEPLRKEIAARNGIAFDPGVIVLSQIVRVDKAEESITALIYKDENGNKSNIPITVTPVTEQMPTGGR